MLMAVCAGRLLSVRTVAWPGAVSLRIPAGASSGMKLRIPSIWGVWAKPIVRSNSPGVAVPPKKRVY